jgi:hypothetical protein
MRHKLLDLAAAMAQQPSDVIRGTVPQPDPDHLRRRPMQNAEPMKIFILADDHEGLISSMRPDCTVRCGQQTDVADMDGVGVQIGEYTDEARRQILVEEQSGWLLRQPDYS